MTAFRERQSSCPFSQARRCTVIGISFCFRQLHMNLGDDFAAHHTDFIYDKIATVPPLIYLILAHLLCPVLITCLLRWNCKRPMNCGASDIMRSSTCSCCYNQFILMMNACEPCPNCC